MLRADAAGHPHRGLVPALVISELLGVPYADRDYFRRWSDDTANLVDSDRAQLGLFALWQ